VRAIVGGIDARVPLTDVATYQAVEAAARARERFLATVLGAFAALALAIAAMGTYGVVAFATARRTREFGVRMALGASRDRLVRGVLRGSLGLALAGASLGIAGVLLGAPLLGSLLFGVSPYDARSMGIASAVMALIVLGASAVPALRATRVDPLEALREE
jgi:putative ABC transport system permease protein